MSGFLHIVSQRVDDPTSSGLTNVSAFSNYILLYIFTVFSLSLFVYSLEIDVHNLAIFRKFMTYICMPV